MKNYITYLSSDQMKGRKTPSPQLDKAAKYIAFEFKSFGLETVKGSYYQKVKRGEGKSALIFNNVIGFIEGSDEKLKKEVIIIGAHYDHLGVDKYASAKQDSIYNGADDNASGTAGLMLIAKAFASQEIKPKRSLLFIAFGGEEQGGVGSGFYCENPLFPLNKTVAMFNLDMISRNDPKMIHIVGKNTIPELIKVIKTENKKIGFKLDYSKDSFTYRLDSGKFLKKMVPAIGFFSDVHRDYHEVTDEVKLVDCNKAAKAAKLLYYTALSVANSSKYYKLTVQN